MWQFYSERRHEALSAEPNDTHLALAEFAKRQAEIVALSQNIDGLFARAGHPAAQLLDLHGSLFDLKCSAAECDYVERGNFEDPFVPALANLDTTEAAKAQISIADLPHCPKCKTAVLRPAVVWFGEPLPKATIATADKFIQDSEKIDLCLVIGTTAQVWPAAGYVDEAVEKGARVAIVNIDIGDLIPGGGELGLTDRDWFFRGDAAVLVPAMLGNGGHVV